MTPNNNRLGVFYDGRLSRCHEGSRETAEMTRREYDPKQEAAFWDLPRNPTLIRDDPVKHGKDHGPSKTIGDIAREMRRAVLDGATDDELADLIDREFIYGAWKDIVERLPASGHTMLQDFRGMLIGFARDCAQEADDKDD